MMKNYRDHGFGFRGNAAAPVSPLARECELCCRVTDRGKFFGAHFVCQRCVVESRKNWFLKSSLDRFLAESSDKIVWDDQTLSWNLKSVDNNNRKQKP